MPFGNASSGSASSGSGDLLSLAFDHHRAGRLDQAEPLYRQVVAQSPQRAQAWHLLGALCLQSDRAAEAVQAISKAIALDPGQADYFNHLGAAYSTLNDHDAAVSALRRAVQLAPGVATSHFNLGTALRTAGRLEEAVASFRHAVAANPLAAEAHYNLANTLRDLRIPTEAEAAYRAAIAARPGYGRAMINLASLLGEQQRHDEALAMAHQAVAADPSHANAHVTLGTLLRDAGQFDVALTSLRKGVELAPTMAEAHNNLGTVLQAHSRFDEALACYDRALQLDPQLADAHFSRASHMLRQGDLAAGFAEYEWRWKCKSYSTRTFSQPRWNGEPLAGRTILLHAEQGLGDTLQFIRFAAQVQSRGARVVVECQPPLVDLLSSCPGIDQLVPVGAPLPAFDVHCPLMSVSGALSVPIDRLWTGSYLETDPALVNAWRERLAARPGLRIGICWQGNPRHLFDRQRSFPLAQLAPIARHREVQLVSLQKGPGVEQIASAPFPVMELGDELDVTRPFVDTAAVMKSLDLVISADTATCHLAGALGVPTWIALSAHSDWRWFLNREDSPWYPSVRLFRQSTLDDWETVFARMADEVRKLGQATSS